MRSNMLDCLTLSNQFRKSGSERNELSFFENQQKNLEDFYAFSEIEESNPLQIKKNDYKITLIITSNKNQLKIIVRKIQFFFKSLIRKCFYISVNFVNDH